MTLKISHLIGIGLILSMVLTAMSKPIYTDGGYNPATDTIRVESHAPDHVQVHENIHRRMRGEVLVLLAAAIFTIYGFLVNSKYLTGYYLSYVYLSAHAELVAYLLTPIPLTTRGIYVFMIGCLMFANLRMLRYYAPRFNVPITKMVWKDVYTMPFFIFAFWLI